MAEIPLPARFRIVRRLGEGGMGIVYEALDVDRGVHVALKTIRDPTADALARFKREFRALQDVSHPNLVTLGELVEHQGHWFFTMEIVQGEEIVAYVRREPSIETGALAAAETLEIAAGIGASARPSNARLAASAATRGPGFDGARLRSVMRQLASALAALHDAGMVHRDIKPSNVRVDRAGRAVLLDFGLVLDLRTDPLLSATRLAGTPIYMAPEQATRERVGPEADWYAFGVLLYETLTGIVPFEGAPFEVLMRKQSHDPARPSALVEGVPEDLEALCMALLRFDPAARPKQAAILRALGGDETALRSRSHTEQVPFVGRDAELAILSSAFDDMSRGASVAALVRGESGVGKSCLVHRFVEAKALEDPSLFVFVGRCYEREAVPYKAFDGVIDAMTRTLLSRRPQETEGFYPTRPEALLSVFPVLGRLPNFRKLGTRKDAADPHELRVRAFAALREMFDRLAVVHRVVVVVDDIQWADADSLALLAELVRPPDAPPLLLVATMRVSPETAREGDVTAERVGSLFPGLRTIDVKRLSTEEGRNLARLLLRRWAPGMEGAAEAIADGAEGHPLFIDALVHYGGALGEHAGPIRLDEALVSHVAASGDAARLLVELLAVAGTPLRQEVLVTALGAARPEEFSRLVSTLRVAHLVSISGGRAADAIELYHDRVRSAVLAHLDAESIAHHHRALALAFERVASSDAEALARHWRGAGDAKAAAKHAEIAARAAASALAFDRAADWYQVAIDLGAPTGGEDRDQHRDLRRDLRRELHERLGDALANAGRGAAAAAAYRRASEGASAAGRLDLQRRAADQLLRGGHLDEGLDALSAVLATIGMKLPATPLLALVSLVWWRFWVRFRRLRYTPRDATEVAASELTKVDTCWSVSFGLAMVDNIRGAAFQARHLSLALATGEIHRVHRALTLEMPYVARGGIRTAKRLDELMDRVERLTMDIGEPYAMGFYFAALGLAHQLLGRFRAALEASDSAEVFLRDCAGMASELANARLFAFTSLSRLGKMGELCRRQPIYLHEAVERGDVYAAVQYRIGHPSLRWIVEDDVESGRAGAKEAMAIWSTRTFHTEHYYELISHTHFDLYAGDYGRARERVLSQWRPMRDSLLLLVQAVRIQGLHLRASTAIALASDTKDRAPLLASAARDARALEREAAPWAVAFARLTQAGVESVRGGDAARTVALLRDAIAAFDGVSMALHAASSRRALGGLLGGDEGAAMVREADAWMRSETIVSPEKMARLMAPGFWRG